MVGTDLCDCHLEILLASKVYQREMNKILHSLSGCEVYQDDVIVHGGITEEHDAQLEAVLKMNQ